MRLSSLVAVVALPLAAARTATVRGSHEEQQSVHRAAIENTQQNPSDWFDPPSIVYFRTYGADGCGDALCGQCQGDCDSDGDCQGNLVCFQRTAYEAVPGCSGDARPAWDYCYDPIASVSTPAPAPPTTVQFVDNSASGCGNALCGQCEGDCDRDTDCQGNLVCFQRTGDESVAGCSGDARFRWDYCYDPSGPVSAPPPLPTPQPPPPPTPRPDSSTTVRFETYTADGCGEALCGQCEGDCDNDGDCQGNLVCFQRTGDESVAGCRGNARFSWDYCYDPSGPVSAPAPPPTARPAASTTVRFKDYTMDGCGTAACGQCEGDCDRDTDCRGNLICFQRTGDENVAGCWGTALDGWDYCYDPSGPVSVTGSGWVEDARSQQWPAQSPRPPTALPWYSPPAGPPTPRPVPPPSPCKEQTFRGEISPNFYHGAMLGQNDEVHQYFSEAAFPIGIDIDIDIEVMGIDRFDREADEELNFNFFGVDTDPNGPTPYQVPPSEDDVYFIDVIQSMPRCSVHHMKIRNLQYPFAFLELYRVGGAAAYYITFSYPNGCDFASRFVYPHDGWVRDETGGTRQKCQDY